MVSTIKTFFLLVLSLFGQSQALDCSTFDPNKITLLSFDMFAALMDLYTSLDLNVAQILPSLSTSEVNTFVNDWVGGYGSYGNAVFNEDITGPYPFQWTLNDTLDSTLTKMNLEISSDEYYALTQTWGNLIPWAGTTETLTKLYNANFSLAPLSNGDTDTLNRAWSNSFPNIKFSNIYSSDFPVGKFKPQADMYAQVINDGIDPETYMHIAGAPGDGQGGREYGIYDALAWNQPIIGDYEPCFILNNITDLLSIFGLE
mmetsp:Transcript_6698/g.8658  ORF Transcript_6698/g.8658 Transcript_6698/m.8658 type:complete len:258 (+) Transcript_6698:45-818(+)